MFSRARGQKSRCAATGWHSLVAWPKFDSAEAGTRAPSRGEQPTGRVGVGFDGLLGAVGVRRRSAHERNWRRFEGGI